MRSPSTTSLAFSPKNHLPRVAVVIVNFNSSRDILTCVQSFSAVNYPNYFFIVVDNNSTEDLLELEEEIGRRNGIFVRSPENGGFAAANNLGIHHARACSADYVWLLNPDTVVSANSLSAFVARAEESSELVVFGSKILYGNLDPHVALRRAAIGPACDATERIWSAGGKVDFSQNRVEMFAWGKADDGSYDTDRECDYLPGCSMFFPASLIPKVGLMSEEFFMYFEETDWCLRMKDAGVKLLYVPESVVWHRFVDEKMQSPLTVYYYNRNELFFWFSRKAWRARVQMLLEILFKKLPQVRKALRQAPSLELQNIFRAHLRAYEDFLLNRRGLRF